MPKTSKHECKCGSTFIRKDNLTYHKRTACPLETVKIRFPCECGKNKIKKIEKNIRNIVIHLMKKQVH